MDSDDGSHLQAFGGRSAMPPPPLASFADPGDAAAAASAHGSHHHHRHHHHHHHHLSTGSSSDHPQLLTMPYDYSNGAAVVTGLMASEAPRFSMNAPAAYGDHHHRHHRHPQPLLPEAAAGDEPDAGRSAGNSSDLAPEGSVMAENPAAAPDGGEGVASDRAKILSHPLFPRLVQVYVNCRKIGAPAEVVAVLEEASDLRHIHSFRSAHAPVSAVGDDPDLDDFMGAYADKLQVHHDELTESLEEARSFLKRMETQLQALSGGGGGTGRAAAALEAAGRTTGNGRPGSSGNGMDASTAGCQAMMKGGGPGGATTTTTETGGDSSEEEEDEDGSCCEAADYNNNNNNNNTSSRRHHHHHHHHQLEECQAAAPQSGGGGALMIDPVAEESQLKKQLLRKYSGIMICSLKREFLKRKKKGKLPKEARQKLLDWWSQHYKWPYPSENEKAALAEVTGLNQKQINNWFINQRKRHWKPSEDLQYVMQLDAAAAAANTAAHHPHSYSHHHHNHHHHPPPPPLAMDHTTANAAAAAAGNNGSNRRRYDNNPNPNPNHHNNNHSNSNNNNNNNKSSSSSSNNNNHQIISFEFAPSSTSGSFINTILHH